MPVPDIAGELGEIGVLLGVVLVGDGWAEDGPAADAAGAPVPESPPQPASASPQTATTTIVRITPTPSTCSVLPTLLPIRHPGGPRHRSVSGRPSSAEERRCGGVPSARPRTAPGLVCNGTGASAIEKAEEAGGAAARSVGGIACGVIPLPPAHSCICSSAALSSICGVNGVGMLGPGRIDLSGQSSRTADR